MSELIGESEFLYDSAPFPSCHASTIVQTGRGLLCAFFGGTRERDPDVCIWVCRRVDDRWSEPVEVADGMQPDGSRQPTWNPVLFQPRGGPLMLSYKVGPSPSRWWGMVRTSDDDGITWSDPVRLPDGILGPIKNKPVQLEDGTIVSPTSVEGVSPHPNPPLFEPEPQSRRPEYRGREGGNAQSGTDSGRRSGSAPAWLASTMNQRGGAGEAHWRVYFERSNDNGRSWSATALVESPAGIDAIQPSILVHSQSRLQALGRTRSGRMFQTWSQDAGLTWSPIELIELPNCNSGTDAVTLRDGRHLLVYNHSNVEKVRIPLNLAISPDGVAWEAAGVLESEPPGQYSYPAMIQSDEGTIHITYTWRRQRIRHVAIDPQRLRSRPMHGGKWPEAGQ